MTEWRPEPSPEPEASAPPSQPGAMPAPVPAPLPAPAPSRAVATSSNAIIALVLAIASWVSCPIVPAIVGLVFAGKADREIAAGGGRVGGGGLSTAAKIVAWINIGVSLAVIVVAVFVLLLSLVVGT